MHIYKFTHTESNRCYIGQTIQDPKRGKETTKWKNKGTMSWKLVDGIRVWYNKEATV